MKTVFFLIVLTLNFSLFCLSQSDSLNPYSDKEILKLSNQIYELEKKDSLAKATEPNGFELKDKSNISDKRLLVDVNGDSIHSYTGIEIIALSNYLYELEKRDSIRTSKALVKVDTAKDTDILVKLSEQETKVLEKAYSSLEFNSAKDIIKKESYPSLKELADLMTKNPNWRLKIAGHTDDKGNPGANLVLSEHRVEALKNYFVSQGITPDKFKLEWYGATKPIADNDSDQGRQKNRRVEILIIEQNRQ